MAVLAEREMVGFRLGLYSSGKESAVELLDPLFAPTRLDTLAMKRCISDFRQRESSRLIGIFIVEEEHESPDSGEGGP